MTIYKGYRTAGAKAACDPNGPVTLSARHFPVIRHSRIAKCIGPPLAKLWYLFTVFSVVDRHRNAPTNRHQRRNMDMEKTMNRIIAGVALASSAAPAAASEAVDMRFECPVSTANPSQLPELLGLWDVLMDVGGTPSFGLLSIGMSGTELGGSLALTPAVLPLNPPKSGYAVPRCGAGGHSGGDHRRSRPRGHRE